MPWSTARLKATDLDMVSHKMSPEAMVLVGTRLI